MTHKYIYVYVHIVLGRITREATKMNVIIVNEKNKGKIETAIMREYAPEWE